MVAQGEEYSHDGCGQHPPFFLPLVKEQAQQEEEYAYGSHVHRPRGERLRTPVIRHPFRSTLAVLLEQLDHLGFVGIHKSGGRSAVEIRNHQVRQFFPSV